MSLSSGANFSFFVFFLIPNLIQFYGWPPISAKSQNQRLGPVIYNIFGLRKHDWLMLCTHRTLPQKYQCFNPFKFLHYILDSLARLFLSPQGIPHFPLLNTALEALQPFPVNMSSNHLPRPPAIGTIIDNGTLELVSVLGYGGFGVVYRAVDLRFPTLDGPSYAVKCLLHTPTRNAERQRRLHMQEIALHQLASVHPNVVTLHRIIEEDDSTFIVMDYCPDGDLFGQIQEKRRYLGRDELIKHVFLQLLDAVDYCHSLDIYHRDLKPENVLCFDGGLRLAITDFGQATSEKVCEEFQIGSVYHMSPGTSLSFLCISPRRTNACSRMSRWKLCPQWDVFAALQ